MDLSLVKSKLEALQNKGKSSNASVEERTKVMFKPKLGKQTIRIIPLKSNKDFPFQEMKYHYDIGVKVMPALSNWGEKDPIEEFAKELRKEAKYGSEEYKLAGKLSPRTRYYLMVVERGSEDEGTKLWEFGKEMFSELLSICSDDDYGDITDVISGWDLKLETVGPEVTGTKYSKTSVRVTPKQSKLTDDKDLLKRLLNEQPDVKTLYNKYSYEKMKENLGKFLDTTTSEPESQQESQTNTVPNPTGKFDELFKEKAEK